MTILVVGATGATGRLLVEQLLNRGQNVKVIVRSPDRLPVILKENSQLTVIRASVLDLSDTDLASHVNGCEAVASCLGHTITLRGIFGNPRRLVTEAIHRLCLAIKANKSEKPIRLVLMNTTANRNHDLHEPLSLSEKCIISLVRLLLPPQRDNEEAADHLRSKIGQSDRSIEWAIVRPDTLIEEAEVTEYMVYPSPTRSPVFNAGSTSRMNVGHFMADLITDDEIWNRWKGKMPVIYNKSSSKGRKKDKNETSTRPGGA